MTPPRAPVIDSYHQKYNDPAADIVFKSTDGIFFRVHSYVLKAQSSYFQEVLSGANETEADHIDNHSFPIEADEKAIVLFLLLAYNTDINTVNEAQWLAEKMSEFDSVPVVLALATTYGCHIVKDRLFKTLMEQDEWIEAWEVLGMASKHNLVTLAKIAISKMFSDKYGTSNPPKLTLADARKVTLSYRMGYEDAVKETKRKTGEELYDWWPRVALAFSPIEE